MELAPGAGSPPRMRGKVVQDSISMVERGITPACAGKSRQVRPAGLWLWDHPRACGEKTFGFAAVTFFAGSPPRVRGKDLVLRSKHLEIGITPAYAGKSRSPSPLQRPARDHPRVCGEKFERSDPRFPSRGSPPRMRGKAKAGIVDNLHLRITPAYAGKRRMGKNHGI